MLGGVIRRRPWLVIAAWIIIVAILAPYAGRLDQVMKTQTTELLPEKVESVRAEKELSRLYNETGAQRMQADYLVLVHNVTVSLEAYKKLKEPYYDATSRVNGAVLSWIDIVARVESNISSGVSQGLNGSMQLLQAAISVSEGYRAFQNSTMSLAQLVGAVDTAYAQIGRAAKSISANSSRLVNASRAIAIACQYQEAEARALVDVVRAEALLEAYTGAYQNGTLTPADIMRVVELSNLSSQGLPPLTPELVALVYNYTLSIGGPQAFNNTVALELARQIALQALNESISGIPQDLQPMLNAAHNALKAAVSQLPDLRGVVLQQDPAAGQLALLQIVTQTLEQVEPETARGIASSMAAGSDPGLLLAIANATLQAGCRPEEALNATIKAVASLFESEGVPPDTALVLAQSALHGDLSPSLLVEAAIAVVESNAPHPEQVEALAPLLLHMVPELDPDASGLLAVEPLRTSAAAAIVLKLRNATSDPAELAKSLASAGQSPEAITARAYIMLLNSTRGPEAAGLAEALLRAGLLGAGRNEILRNATVLAPLLASKGVDAEQARALLESAARVLEGEADRSEVVNQLVEAALERAWPEIVERLKGLLVEKDLNGFIVLYTPGAGADPISQLTVLRDSIAGALERSGYKGAIVLRGGTEFMTYEMREAALRDVKRSDRMSMVFVIVVMAIVLESIAAVFLPFIGIGFGIISSLAIAYFLAKTGIIDVTTHSRTIMYATGLGLGIDYAVYVSKSFREAASRGLDSRGAAEEAFRRSLRPVIAGATTAMIGFGSMLLAGEFSFISSIGATVPLTILMVMLASITFIPALLAYVGEKKWFWWPRNPYEAKHSNKEAPPRVGRAITRLSGLLLAASIVLGVASYLVVANYRGSYDLSLNLPEDTESYSFLRLFNKYYDPGVLYPVYIIASSPDKAVEINETVSRLDCVARTRIDEALEGRVVFAYMRVNPMSYEGVSCAREIRDAAHSVDKQSLVGGFSAANLDLKEEITSVFYHRVYPVAVTLMFLTMLAAYGGIATALGAVLSVVFAAYLGSALTILFYEHVKGLPVLWYLPVITFTAVLGVGMDYNSFYLARAREECSRDCSRDAVARSISRGTPLVLGLSVIMASAYLGLALSKTPGMASMGLALMLGVLGAGLLSSTLLTPPLITLLGGRAWWPKNPGERRER